MLQMYSIMDKKGSMYSKPFFSRHVAEATRSVQQAFLLPEDQKPWFTKYAADHALYFIGTFDEASGMYTPTSEGVPVWTIEISSLDPAAATPSPKQHIEQLGPKGGIAP